MTEEKEEQLVALTYKEPKPWATLSNEGTLKSFNLEACRAASKSDDGNTVAHTLCILQLLDIIEDYVTDYVLNEELILEDISIFKALENL